MPSITALLSYAAIGLLTSSQLCAASPVGTCPIKVVRDAPSLPTTGSGTQLPAPSTGLALKFVTLGRGVQNYTCASGTPASVGAIAEIFDITAFAKASSDSSDFTGLPAAAAYLAIPGVQQLLDSRMPAGSHATIIGKHYFNSAGVPTFDLSAKDRKSVV
mgnify:FL=1